MCILTSHMSLLFSLCIDFSIHPESNISVELNTTGTVECMLIHSSSRTINAWFQHDGYRITHSLEGFTVQQQPCEHHSTPIGLTCSNLTLEVRGELKFNHSKIDCMLWDTETHETMETEVITVVIQGMLSSCMHMPFGVARQLISYVQIHKWLAL